MVCKGFKSADRFGVKMDFDIILIDYQVDTDWIKDKILDMKKTMDLDQVSENMDLCQENETSELVEMDLDQENEMPTAVEMEYDN
mgnify:CR=1 FL=1